MATNAYLEFLLEHLAALGPITERRMFGGHCLYCDGTVFALVAGNALYLKADNESRAAFEARGLEQFRPFDDPKMTMNYYQPPPEFFEDPEAMAEWGRRAIQAGLRGKSRAKKSAKPAGKRRVRK